MANPDLDALLAAAAGFGRCPVCRYFATGSAALCYACARRTMEPLASIGERCRVCDHPFGPGERACGNPVCKMSERWFAWNYAIAMRTGVLKQVINDYKYSGPGSRFRAWAAIFGRILLGFLDANEPVFSDIDLFVASPTFVGPGGRRSWDHIRGILVAADTEQGTPGRWAFDLEDPPAVVKTADTDQMAGHSYQERKAIAQGSLRQVLHVPDRGRTAGKRLVVVDDVFTDGLTLREVARVLRQQGGAEAVYGVTLARQRYQGAREPSKGTVPIANPEPSP